jgi:hypothetical protein
MAALATGVLLAGTITAAIVGSGHYPRTGDPRLVLWASVFLASAVAVFSARRVSRAMTRESPSQRVAASMFVGFFFGALAIVVLGGVVFVAFAILVVIGLHNLHGGAF